MSRFITEYLHATLADVENVQRHRDNKGGQQGHAPILSAAPPSTLVYIKRAAQDLLALAGLDRAVIEAAERHAEKCPCKGTGIRLSSGDHCDDEHCGEVYWDHDCGYAKKGPVPCVDEVCAAVRARRSGK